MDYAQDRRSAEQRQQTQSHEIENYRKKVTKDLSTIADVAIQTVAKLADDLHGNGHKLWHAYYLKGGWEPWLQVELALALDKTMKKNFGKSCHVEVFREQPVYAVLEQGRERERQKTDIMVRLVNLHDKSIRVLLIELKCQSASNRSNLATQVKKDIDKVSLTTMDARVVPCRALNIFAYVQSREKKMKDWKGFSKFHHIDYVTEERMSFFSAYRDFIFPDNTEMTGSRNLQ
jgi:hypothetical protein